MLESKIKNKFILILIIVTFLVILLGIFTIHKASIINNKIKDVLITESPIIFNASSSLLQKESIVESMANFIKEKFNQESYSFSKDSLNNFVSGLEPFTKSILEANENVHGAWITLNPDLFLEVSQDKLIFQNFSYTCWYYKDVDNKLIKAPRTNDRITPENDPYYFKAAEAGKLIITQLYTDTKINVEMVSLAIPVYVDNKLLGVAGIDITKESLMNAISDIAKTSGNSKIFIFDSKGILVIGTAEPSEKVKNYLREASVFADSKPSLGIIIDSELIILENANKQGPILAGVISLSKIYGNINCLLYTLYGSCIVLFVLLIICCNIAPENELPRTAPKLSNKGRRV